MLQSKRLMLVAVVMLNSSCFMARVVAKGPAGEHHSNTGVSLFWGLTSTESDADECPNGLQRVATYHPWYTWLLSTITIGIVTPIVKDYTCMAGVAPQTVIIAPLSNPPMP